jgi:hypothetical protein
MKTTPNKIKENKLKQNKQKTMEDDLKKERKKEDNLKTKQILIFMYFLSWSGENKPNLLKTKHNSRVVYSDHFFPSPQQIFVKWQY